MKRGRFLECYPEVPYVVLAFAPVVALVALARTVDVPLEPALILGAWTPNIAAFIVLRFVLREKGGVRGLLAGWTRWRVDARWYVAALSPFLIALLTAGVFLALGRSPSIPAVQPIGLPLLSLFLLSIVTGAMGEELGWRGFLLPRLQKRYSALTSSLIVGTVWALWHLPLWFVPGQGWESIPYWAFALGAISSSVLFTFVLNNTGGSLFMASLIHLSLNYGLGAAGIMGWLPSPGEAWTVASLLYALYAVAIVIWAGPERLSRKGRVAPSLVGEGALRSGETGGKSIVTGRCSPSGAPRLPER